MDLRTYLFKNRLTQRYFADLCGCNNITISHIVNGKRPGKRIAKEIEEKTKGLVTYPEILKSESIEKEAQNVV